MTVKAKNLLFALRLIPALLALGAAPALFADQAAPAAEALVREMAAFDQAYIAALALSNQTKAEATARSMDALDGRWRTFLAASSDAFPGDRAWKAGLEKVGAVLAKAAEETKAGKIAEVHETLEEVRAIFVELRAERKLSYYIDHLNRYHEVMELAAAAAVGKSADSFSSAEAAAVAAILPGLRAEWKKALEAEFDRELYLVGEAKAVEIKKAMQGTQGSIDRLAAALESGSSQQVFAAVNGLKPAFTKSFLMFAKFDL